MIRVALLIATLCLVAATAAPAQPTSRCSAAGLSTKLAKQKLPAATAKMRQQIVNAAVACDYAKLQALGNRGQKLTFSYGGERTASAYWRRLEAKGQKPLATLVRILRLPVRRNETGAYAWPSAYTQRPTKHDWDLLVRAGILTRKQADNQRLHGNVYYGFRVAILANGDWQFFVSGD
jgi:hypothetical protein